MHLSKKRKVEQKDEDIFTKMKIYFFMINDHTIKTFYIENHTIKINAVIQQLFLFGRKRVKIA